MSKKELCSVKLEKVMARATELGLPVEQKKAFVHMGFKAGVRLSAANQEDVKRAFLYRAQPEGAAFIHFTEQERKDQRLGGVTAEIDFSKSLEEVEAAIELALQAAVQAGAPAPKPVKEPKAPKAPKAPKPAVETAETQPSA